MSVSLSDGTVFATRYRVVRRIAMGGMGAVYEVTHLETERRLALKVMLPHIVQSEDMRERFRREARVAAQVESEHIVDVFDAGVDDVTGMPFIVMELLRGEELAKTLHRLGRLGALETVTLLHQASLALDKTHKANIVHRDLKPENLFLTEREDGQPRVKVLDFGIAKLLAEGSTQDPGTRSLGTPLYMAPEQFRSGQPISPATDIYALGMIAYTMLTGASYWAEEAKDSSNVFMFAGAVMQGAREPATQRAHRRGVPLPPAFDAWFAAATAMLAQDRFPSASIAVAALADALGVPRPGNAFNASTSGPLRLSGAFAAPSSQGAPMPAAQTGPQRTTALDDPATLLYSASQPRFGASGPQGGAMGSTGAAYGSATGASISGSSPATGKIMVAIAAGIGIGAVGLAALFLVPSGGPPVAASSAIASASSAPIASASAPTASSAPIASASAEPATSASAASVPSAAPTATPVTARPASPPSKGKPPPPASTGKKTIYVRD